MSTPTATDYNELLRATSDIVTGFVMNNTIAAGELPNLITATFDALSALEGGQGRRIPPLPLGLDPRKTVSREAIVSLLDGKAYKSLKRHLTKHGLTPDQYREAYGLPADYPMVAASYAERRSALAKAFKLGHVPVRRRAKKAKTNAQRARAGRSTKAG